ncbi:hypothetical protein LTR17_022949 [Elasticomyces elasticus]|nr:hypothetical protein LTR17_022949 [Elasticomyces elasticus]
MKTDIIKLKAQVRRIGGCMRKAALRTGLLASSKPGNPIAASTANSKSEDQSTSAETSSKAAVDQALACEQQQCDEEGEPKILSVKIDDRQRLAMVPNSRLMKAMQVAICGNRAAQHGEELIRNKMGKLIQQIWDLDEQIEDMESRVAVPMRPHAVDGEVEISPQEKLAALVKQRAEVGEAHKACQQAIKDKYRGQHENVQDILYEFEQMFVGAGLLKEDTPQDLDEVQNVDELAIGEAKTDSKLGVATAISSGEEPEPGPDEVRRAEAKRLIDDYQFSVRDFHFAEKNFDSREEHFEDDEDERKQKQKAGDTVETTTVFHRGQLEQTRLLTRQLIEAENKVAAAKAAAVAAGVQVQGSDVESGFVDDVDDGYIISSEDDEEEDVDRSAIEAWMELVPECDTDEMPEVDIDDWDAKSMGISDSMSMVAEDGERRRIDKWWAMCERTRGELEVVAES